MNVNAERDSRSQMSACLRSSQKLTLPPKASAFLEQQFGASSVGSELASVRPIPWSAGGRSDHGQSFHLCAGALGLCNMNSAGCEEMLVQRTARVGKYGLRQRNTDLSVRCCDSYPSSVTN